MIVQSKKVSRGSRGLDLQTIALILEMHLGEPEQNESVIFKRKKS